VPLPAQHVLVAFPSHPAAALLAGAEATPPPPPTPGDGKEERGKGRGPAAMAQRAP